MEVITAAVSGSKGGGVAVASCFGTDAGLWVAAPPFPFTFPFELPLILTGVPEPEETGCCGEEEADVPFVNCIVVTSG
jgi:hypothetical protein